MRGLLLFVLVGCVGVAPPPPPAVQVPLGAPLAVADESMVYEVTLRGLRIARVQVAVGKPGWVEGRPAIIVKSRGQTDGLIALIGDLEWELTTTIDLETGLPLGSIEDVKIEFRGDKDHEHDERSDGTHTLHSAATALRGWRSTNAQRTELQMRIVDARIEIAIQDAARELLDTSKPAVRYDGIARKKFPFKLWFSDDAARVPLRLQTATKWGDVGIELVEYEAPAD